MFSRSERRSGSSKQRTAKLRLAGAGTVLALVATVVTTSWGSAFGGRGQLSETQANARTVRLSDRCTDKHGLQGQASRTSGQCVRELPLFHSHPAIILRIPAGRPTSVGNVYKGPHSHPMIPAGRPTSASNKRAAERDAARLLHRLVLPVGAIPLSREPQGDDGYLKKVDSYPIGLVVDRHRFWLLHEPLRRAASFIEAHSPVGPRRTVTGYASGRHIPANKSFTFLFTALDGRISTRQLEVTLVALPPHQTGIRVDAQDIWIVPRPISEKIPAGVHEVDVRTRKANVRVKSAAKVRRLIHLFDALPIVQHPAPPSCPPDTIRRPPLSVRFLSADGITLARATVPGSFASGACGPIQFWIGSHRQKPLSGPLYGRIERVLGVRSS